MVYIDKGQMAALKRLMQDDAWDILVGVVLAEYIAKLNSQPVTGNNEFETLRALHTKQGRVDGLVEFFENAEKLNFD